jgi:hypothetical protein
MEFYRIYWIDEKSYSASVYTRSDAWREAKVDAPLIGRFRIVRATF